MTQDERWLRQYEEMMTFMETNHRRPSKHRLEEHDMLNWFKSTGIMGDGSSDHFRIID